MPIGASIFLCTSVHVFVICFNLGFTANIGNMLFLDTDRIISEFQIYESQYSLRIGYYVNDGYLPCIPAVERAMEIAKAALEKKGHKVGLSLLMVSATINLQKSS